MVKYKLKCCKYRRIAAVKEKNMTMKRWISLLLAAVMTMTLLTACGEDQTEEDKDALQLRIRATTEQTSPTICSLT